MPTKKGPHSELLNLGREIPRRLPPAAIRNIVTPIWDCPGKGETL